MMPINSEYFFIIPSSPLFPAIHFLDYFELFHGVNRPQGALPEAPNNEIPADFRVPSALRPLLPPLHSLVELC